MKLSQTFIFSFLFASISCATGLYASSAFDTTNALQMRLDVPGFDAISSAIRSKLLQDINNQPINDFDQNLSYGIHGEFSGLSYSVVFKDFHIVPTSGALDVDVEFGRIAVHIDKARLSKRLGVTLRTTCTNTNMVAGTDGSLHLRMKLAATVQNGQVVLSPNSVSFPLPDDQYEVSGPEECTGSLGIGAVLRFAIHRALAHANEAISAKLEEKIKDIIPAFGDDLNALLASEIPLKLGGSSTIPLRSVILSATPFSLDITPTAANFALSVTVSADQRPLRDERLSQHTARESLFSDPDIIAGSLGLRTALLNELLAQVTPLLPTSIAIDPSQSTTVGEIFSRQGLSALLPDLNHVAMDEERVYAQLGFAVAPSLTAYRMTDGHVTLVFSMPDVRLALSIKQNGALLPYFNLNFAANLPVRATLDGDSIKLSIVKPGRISVSGAWAPGYVPTVDIFEQDLADTIFSSILDILYGAGPLTRFDVPPIPLDAQSGLRVSNPHVDNDFIIIDLKKY